MIPMGNQNTTFIAYWHNILVHSWPSIGVFSNENVEKFDRKASQIKWMAKIMAELESKSQKITGQR